MTIKEVLDLVKKNKKYRYIDDNLILEKLKKYYFDEDMGKREIEGIVKEIRAEIHKSYGVFQIKKRKREKYLDELKNLLRKCSITDEESVELHKKILMTNVSTKERLDYYKEIYEKLFKIIGKLEKVVDLGCGLNIFSFVFMGLDKLDYYGYDISKDDVGFINRYIKLNPDLKGKAEVMNILKDFSKVGKGDVCFLFKFLDSIGKDYKFYEELIKGLRCKFVVVSFATRKISGKKMRFGNRRWIEYMLERMGRRYEKFSVENEIFYVIGG